MANPVSVKVLQLRIRTKPVLPGKPPVTGRVVVRDTPRHFVQELTVQTGSTENMSYVSAITAILPWKVVDPAGVVLGVDISQDRSGGYSVIYGEAAK